MRNSATVVRKIAVLGVLAGALACALAFALALAGCGGKGASGPPRAPVVSFVTIQPRSVPLTSELSGRTVAYRIAEIRPQVSGIILERLFEEGSDVAEGQVLYKIDPAVYQAAFDNAKAALARAEANLTAIRLRKDRLEKLLPTNAVSRQDYDDATAGLKQAEAAVESARAQLASARINLRYTDVTAPIGGRIGRSSVTEGAVVTAYQPVPLATIQQLDPIYLDVPQSTAEVMRLKRHLADGRLNPDAGGRDNIRLIEEDGTEYERPGSLQFRDVSVDPTTGSVILRALFANPDAVLLPDMFVRCVVTEGVIPDAVMVPQQAVARDSKGSPYAWIVDADGKARIRQLALDRAVADEWLVTSGLAAGDRVIVEGLQSLRQDGTPVHAAPFAPAGERAGAESGAAGAAHADRAGTQ
jgi:membrane fusion protein (multidrug efflux system)